MYNYILFDLDGTITDTGEGIYNGVIYALEKYGITENNKTTLNNFIGPPLVDSFMNYYSFSKEKALQAVEGVSDVNVSLDEKQATVTADPALAETLKKAVADAGYEVVDIK